MNIVTLCESQREREREGRKDIEHKERTSSSFKKDEIKNKNKQYDYYVTINNNKIIYCKLQMMLTKVYIYNKYI